METSSTLWRRNEHGSLPDNGQRVLCMLADRRCLQLRYIYGEFRDAHNNDYKTVAWWMPQPSTPDEPTDDEIRAIRSGNDFPNLDSAYMRYLAGCTDDAELYSVLSDSAHWKWKRENWDEY